MPPRPTRKAATTGLRRPARPSARLGARQYHHGNLRAALLEEALRTIQREGVQALTLRTVGERLGVSRTALYRHFADKSALLGAVARDGFRMLRVALTAAWEAHGGGRAGFNAMGRAYVSFAVENPAHYRVMFGAVVAQKTPDPELALEGAGAFQALLDAVLSLQRSGDAEGGDALALAHFVWSVVHGLATLTIDGILAHQQADLEAVTASSLERIWTGIRRT